ncbi:MAG: zinc ribbon domain-containing protein [Halorubrum sp.]
MRRRLLPPLAAFLAIAFPGLGHLLLRRYGRAIVWHTTIVGGALVLYTLYDAGPIDPAASVAEITATVPTDVFLPVGLLVSLSALDALLVGKAVVANAERADATAAAIRNRASEASSGAPPEAVVGQDEDGTSQVECPSCGRETDADIEFCHWCTEPLPWADENDERV